MMSDIDAAVIKRTQDTLGKYVKKPVLSEKLLKKPPVRFLFDVFSAVIKETGYFENLYSAEELNYENITDRDTKMKFLQKMIDAIKIITKEPLTVRASKIVAGHEPEKTNELLQMIAMTIENKLDWESAVEVMNNAGSSSKPKQKIREKDSQVKEKKSTDRSPKFISSNTVVNSKKSVKTEIKEKSKPIENKEKPSKKPSKLTETKKKEEKKLKIKSSPPDKESLKKVSNKKPTESPPKVDPKREAKTQPSLENLEEQNKEPVKQNDIIEPMPNEEVKPASPGNTISPSIDFKEDERRDSTRAEEILLAAAAEDTNAGSESRRSSGSKRSSGKSRRSGDEKSHKSKPDDINTQATQDPVDSLKTVAEESSTDPTVSPHPKSHRSPTPTETSEVKRESTFIKDESKETVSNPSRPRTSLRPPSARLASARPGAPRRRDKNIEIILQPNDQIKLSGISVKLETFNSELEDDGENLVIIENVNTEDQLQAYTTNDKNSLEDESLQQGHLVQQILETQKELVQDLPLFQEQIRDKENDITNLNSRQSSARQMNSLRDVIQNLTKSVNPLGKLMDFIPEDIDAMQLELTMWRDTYNQSSAELKRERSLTESVTEPMKNQLVTIEASIKEYHEMIDSCRAKILQNAEKIHRLLTTQ